RSTDYFSPRYVDLTPEARGEFEPFRKFVKQAGKGLDGLEQQWVAKAPAHVLRLAGTLCFLDWARRGGPEPQAIEAPYMLGAIELWREYFWPHSRAALQQIG
ncbi:MAG TPA: DUF3987 domain-containing protein, partial [Xanthobacteraceae bacterium]